MNQEAHNIVDELKKFEDKPKGGGVYEVTGALSFLAFRTARLQVLLAEEQERSAAKLERFTRWLVYLTFALLLLTAFLCYDAYSHRQSENLKQQSTTK